MEYTVRNYDAKDETDVVNLWNQVLVRDEITLNTFRRKVVLDLNFDERGCFVAVADEKIVGFLLSIRRRYPYYDLGLEPGKGWITVFFVHPNYRKAGIASHLIRRAEAFLLLEDVREVSVSDYTPNYFIPGVDVDAYACGHEFLKKRGYKKVDNVYGMGRSLMDFEVSAEMCDHFHRLQQAGLTISVFEPRHTLRALEFLRKNYPGDLFRVAHDRLMENPECDEILLALKGDEVLGFSHFLDEHFGPFGIAKEYSGRGLGPWLYCATVEQMRKKGRRNLWLAWTTGRAKDFYHKVGLKVTRRHVIMKKQLHPSGV
ncbi:MAG: GNAT family N-acetyltransferase [Ignavibacteriae bacterium]|nr:GNAT family N-acetyltransferase [Ignavibacteriota bacterium]